MSSFSHANVIHGLTYDGHVKSQLSTYQKMIDTFHATSFG
jgi:hypothetical protein